MNNFIKRFASKFLTDLKTIVQAVIFSVIIWFFYFCPGFPEYYSSYR